jgi:tRNA-Thr(GGU) m(6)t(6)A37 methyltransferase TsaA
MTNSEHSLQTIGIVHSPFKEKFGIPRQPGLIKSCSAKIELIKPFNTPEFVKELEHFTDIWLIFGFHQNKTDWKAMVRPPRLGGNKKVGVFASRSPFRPNGLGLSRVELKKVCILNNKVFLEISCPDIVDGTPIYDIKPYIHYADSNEHAVCGFAPSAPSTQFNIEFSSQAELDLTQLNNKEYGNLKQLIIEVLAQDPRPAYKKDQEIKPYGFKLYDLNIVWVLNKTTATIEKISKLSLVNDF